MEQGIDMDQVCTWTVIQFIDDATVEAVPSTWIQGDFCHWPSFSKSKLLSAIRKCEPLNTCWPTHKVKIFRNATFDDYMIARNKAKIAEETSDLNSASESNGLKRRRIQKIISSSEDSSLNESQLASPPKIKKYKVKANKKENRNILRHEEQKENDLTIQSHELLISEESLIQPNSEHSSTFGSRFGQKNETQLPCYKCIENDKNYKTIIQQNHILRSLMVDTLSVVNEIKEILCKNVQGERQNKLNKNRFFNNPGINFPINTDEEFEHLENLLNNEEEFKDAVEELSRLGGSSAYDLIKRILSLTLTNEQTIKYSWLGRKGKRIFKNLNIAKVLISAVDQAGLCKSIKDSENAIQAWLRRASDRRTNFQKKF